LGQDGRPAPPRLPAHQQHQARRSVEDPRESVRVPQRRDAVKVGSRRPLLRKTRTSATPRSGSALKEALSTDWKPASSLRLRQRHKSRRYYAWATAKVDAASGGPAGRLIDPLPLAARRPALSNFNRPGLSARGRRPRPLRHARCSVAGLSVPGQMATTRQNRSNSSTSLGFRPPATNANLPILHIW